MDVETITNLANALFAFIPAHYAGLVALGFLIITHLVQYLPEKVTTKIPNWVMVFLNVIGGKHGASKSAKTDLKGNPIDHGKLK